jgi:hypothetical protein
MNARPEDVVGGGGSGAVGVGVVVVLGMDAVGIIEVATLPTLPPPLLPPEVTGMVGAVVSMLFCVVADAEDDCIELFAAAS